MNKPALTSDREAQLFSAAAKRSLAVVALLAATASGCIVNPVPTPTNSASAFESANIDDGPATGAGAANRSGGGRGWSDTSADAGSNSGSSGPNADGSDAGAVPQGPDTIDNGNTGLSQGGAQDFGLFRQILEEGGVPGTSAMDDLGFFNEHKIDYPPPECGQDMCVHGLLGQMGNMITGSTCTVLQIGMNTHLQANKMKRPPLHIVLAVDTSSSMKGAPIGYLKQGLKQMLDHLEDGDKVSIVSFSSNAKVVLESAPLSDKLAIEKAIIGLKAGGDTNLYSGLFSAFKIANKHHDKSWDNRVVLLTDGQPTAGLTNPGKLVSLAAGYAKKGIGVTTIGVGAKASNGVLAQVAEVGAGNYYFLDQPLAVKEVFTEEVKTFLVPVALDVEIEVKAEDAYVVGGAYGTHGYKGDSNGGTIKIPTLFIAGRKAAAKPLPGKGAGRRGGGGAIILELMPLPGVQKGPKVATLNIKYKHPKTGSYLTQTVNVTFGKVVVPDGSAFFTNDTVEKGFVMLNILAAFNMASELAYDSDPGAARGVLLALRPQLAKWLKKAEVADPDIEDDLKYVDLFIANLKKLSKQTPVSLPPEPWPMD